MQKYFITLIVVFLTSIVNGQVITMPDLLRLHRMNNEDAETFLLNHKYEFLKTDKNDTRTSIIYSADASSSNREYSNFAVFIIDYNIGGRTITHQTSKTNYLNAKNYCKKNGFKFIKTETKEKSITSTYEKGKWQIELLSFENETQGGSKMTSYMIKVGIF